jgi:hypothetical protein
MQTPTGNKLVQDPKRTKMVAATPSNEPANKGRELSGANVLAEVLRPLALQDKPDKTWTTYVEGQKVLLTAEQAEELCDTHWEGFFATTGHTTDDTKQKIFKARRL